MNFKPFTIRELLLVPLQLLLAPFKGLTYFLFQECTFHRIMILLNKIHNEIMILLHNQIHTPYYNETMIQLYNIQRNHDFIVIFLATFLSQWNLDSVVTFFSHHNEIMIPLWLKNVKQENWDSIVLFF